ncbi:N-acetyltransferase family protein [Rummeliibacillus pycnus]|uniref:GNAT family N-acetyltransferase n=1 Tax=Rummeliibacillus pycnus TaxID=101070 RepID=UPI003D2C5267
MKFTTRKMRVEDIPQVQDVAKVSWHSTYDGIIPRKVQDNFLNTAYSDDNLKKRVERTILFVAEFHDKIVGFANYSPIKEDGIVELGAIYLYPEYQGNGIGTALLQKGIEYFNNVKEIYINVENDNVIGKNFYHAKGFKVVSEFDDEFDGHILKTVRMVLKV